MRKYVNLIPLEISKKSRNKKIKMVVIFFLVLFVSAFFGVKYYSFQLDNEIKILTEKKSEVVKINERIKVLNDSILDLDSVAEELNDKSVPLNFMFSFLGKETPKTFKIYSIVSHSIVEDRFLGGLNSNGDSFDSSSSDEVTYRKTDDFYGVSMIEGSIESTNGNVGDNNNLNKSSNNTNTNDNKSGGSRSSNVSTNNDNTRQESSSKNKEVPEYASFQKSNIVKGEGDLLKNRSKDIYIRGYSESIYDIGKFVKKLKAETYVSGVEMSEISEYSGRIGRSKFFEIRVKIGDAEVEEE